MIDRDEKRRRDFARLPLEKKLDIIQQIYVAYEGIVDAWTVLETTLKRGIRRSEAATGCIIGDPRCGKSETVKRFIEKMCGVRPIKGKPYQLIEGNGLRIVYADLTNGATPLTATQMILRDLFKDIMAMSLKEGTASPRLVEMFILHKIDMFIIDEAQQTFNGHGPGAALKLGKWLLTLENARSFTTVLVGDTRLNDLFVQVPAAAKRKGGVARLKPFSFSSASQKKEFGKFIAEFVRNLPFLKTCLADEKGNCDPAILFKLYFATRGVPGVVSILTESATEAAFRRSNGAIPEELELRDFKAGFDYLLKNDPLMKNCNPFAVANEKEIPTIPLTPEAAEEERLAALGGRRASNRGSKSSVGGRILGD
jgi:hypothetical protein